MALINKQGVVAADAPDAPKIEFPCDNYVIKVVAMDETDIQATVTERVRAHAPEFDESTIKKNVSSKGRFVSFSLRIRAQSETQLAGLHEDLMAVEAIKMVM